MSKYKKYLQTNMARSRIERQCYDSSSTINDHNESEYKDNNYEFFQINDTHQYTIGSIDVSDGNMGSQEFSTAATNQKLMNIGKMQRSESLRKCESVENISSNLLHNGILAELDKINYYI